ncbi:RagB/SusD family nutrient uptake outer membrane protein [Arachidicoccus sp.]|uniref:RagB/SusD family nutrient uptake outer membrane protein n=1 Tax=Arachidicoccus sp. TaxID=1872624 RepID=UPI003D26361F
MKTRYYIFFTVACLVTFVGISSCNKFLDAVPTGVLNKDSIFSSLVNTQGYLAQVYANLPQEFDNENINGTNYSYSGSWTGSSDEANNINYSNVLSNLLNQSTWNINIGGTIWTNFYKPVRTATDFIANVDRANPAEVPAYLKVHFKGEARALRAIFYYLMLRMYGSIVILPNQIDANASGNDIYYPRTPFDSCISYITGQLDSAYNEIQSTDDPTHPADQPLLWDGVVQYGRVTTGVCKAYKEQALLLAASPLFNGNTDYAGLKNKDGSTLIPQTYDPNKWKLAAQAAKDFIDEFVPGTYDLYTETGSDPFTNAYNSCRDVLLNDWNKEWIFGRAEDGFTGTFQSDISPSLIGFSNVGGGKGILSVNQSMVDAYFMNNGRTINDPQSGYQGSGFSDFKSPYDVKARNTFNQWVNREPRFYVGVTYNGSYWINQGSSNTEVIVDYTYSGNSGRQQSTVDVSSTGYNVRKFLRNGSGNLGYPYIRLAMIYLDYAEALNESDPGNPDILKYLNLIRQRAGIATYGSGSNQIPAPDNQSDMRQVIRQERQVELAFEGVRYFDIRRWKIAPQTIGQNVYGMNMMANGNEFYQKTLDETRRFLQRDYLWPIPYNEILKDNLLVQNPGW